MAWFECVGGSSLEILETASVFRWFFQNGTTCWGIMKKTDGTCIGQNGDNSTSDILLDGDLMSVLFHGNSQDVTITAKSSITLKKYSSGRTLGTITPDIYTLSSNETQTFTPDVVYGGLYLEATSN